MAVLGYPAVAPLFCMSDGPLLLNQHNGDDAPQVYTGRGLAQGESSGIAVIIFNPCARWNGRSTPRLEHFAAGNEPRYLSFWRLTRPHGRSGRVYGEEEISCSNRRSYPEPSSP